MAGKDKNQLSQTRIETEEGRRNGEGFGKLHTLTRAFHRLFAFASPVKRESRCRASLAAPRPASSSGIAASISPVARTLDQSGVFFCLFVLETYCASSVKPGKQRHPCVPNRKVTNSKNKAGRHHYTHIMSSVNRYGFLFWVLP